MKRAIRFQRCTAYDHRVFRKWSVWLCGAPVGFVRGFVNDGCWLYYAYSVDDEPRGDQGGYPSRWTAAFQLQKAGVRIGIADGDRITRAVI